MLADRGSRRRILVFGLLVVASIGMLAVGQSGPAGELRRGVAFALSPVTDTLADATRSITGMVGAVAEIEDLRRQNVALEEEVARLEGQIAGLEAVEVENDRLARVLETRRTLDRETITAEVTVRQASQFERMLTIDRGREAGIEVGDPVVSEGGALAGTITDVGDGWSQLRLINDTRSLVIGLDRRSRATGEVVGRLAAPLAMTDIRGTDRVDVGDAVITAGIDLGRRFRSIYPKGLPIGRVIAVETEPGSVFQTALVEPAADLDRIETVLVITDHKAPRRADDELIDEG